jgi:hypothetical protein
VIDKAMQQRSYIILVVGAALLIPGIVISVLWTEFFAGTIMRENTVLRGISIRPASSGNTSIQVMDTSRSVSLVIHVASTTTIGGGVQIPNNALRETVRNPNGVVMTRNEFTKQLFTTFKPNIIGKYTITVYNLGNSPVSIGVLVGNFPFVGINNQTNVNFLGRIIVSVILIVTGIIILIAGVIVLILDRRRISPKRKPSR